MPDKGTDRPDLTGQDLTAEPHIYFPRINLTRALLPQTKLSKLDMRYCLLTGANLVGADLTQTDLTGANLTDADLTGADLTGANLARADLTRTILRHANLQNADLTGITGITSNQIGGANLQGIKNKEAISLDSTSQVDEALKNVAKLYQLLITTCLIVSVIVITTTDIDIITHTGTAKIPIIDVQLPKDAFFIIAPFLILTLFMSFHLHLIRAWEMMLEFPAVYPDGRTIGQKTYPLHLNSLSFRSWKQLKDKLPRLTKTRACASAVTAFWTAPIALACVDVSYSKGQTPNLLGLQLACTLLTILFAHKMWHRWLQILAGNRKIDEYFSHQKQNSSILPISSINKTYFKSYNSKITIKSASVPLRLSPRTCVNILIIIIFIFYYRSIVTITTTIPTQNNSKNSNSWWESTVKQLITPQLVQAEIVLRPSSWRQRIQPPKTSPGSSHDHSKWEAYLKQYDQITNIPDLTKAHLRFANAKYTFAPKVNLTMAYLVGATFEGADLTFSRLLAADLTDCDLTRAQLLLADLTAANCRSANFTSADLRGADLTSADLTGADLTGAHLEGANLTGADLHDAKLQGAQYTPTGDSATKWPSNMTLQQVRNLGVIAVDDLGHPWPNCPIR